MDNNHAKALKFLCIAVFLLFGAPKINIKIGPLPFYLIDFVIVLTVYYARKLAPIKYQLPFKFLVGVILSMILFNEFINGLIIGTLLQPIYLMIRMTLAVSLFFVIPKIVRYPKHLIKVLKYALVGAFITSLLLIFSSLPMTRGISTILLSNPFLTPNAVSLSTKILNAAEQGIRGSSLVGVSILSGAFLNVIWPLLTLLLTYHKLKGVLKIILHLTLILVPVAVIMTYSRGAILALILVILGFVLFQKGKTRAVILSIASILIIIFSSIGLDSNYFFFERIENRTSAALNNPYEDERESERIYSYTQPFEHLVENPIYFFLGEGFSRKKIANSPVIKGNEYRGQRADHAVFASAYYAYCLFTSLLIVLLFISQIYYTIRIVNKTTNISGLFSSQLSRLLIVVLIGFVSWFSFGHAAVSQPRGAMLMFFVFGLVVSQLNFYKFEYLQTLNKINK